MLISERVMFAFIRALLKITALFSIITFYHNLTSIVFTDLKKYIYFFSQIFYLYKNPKEKFTYKIILIKFSFKNCHRIKSYIELFFIGFKINI